VVERRAHYERVKSVIESGGITDIADLITYNLDIEAFVFDLLCNIDAPKFIKSFYAALDDITILDPTCGSGAFLFAALNILEPLYNACLSRGALDEKTLAEIDAAHPSRDYFIHKSIILNNLYGVDIMREAAETAKLRLFLKLVSDVTPNYNADNVGIEPLPDIDFNIKSGNALIGYANKEEVDSAFDEQNNMFAGETREEVQRAMKELGMAIAHYKALQLGKNNDFNSADFLKAKSDATERQTSLKQKLDDRLRKLDYAGVSEQAWSTHYLPFHWVSEFYEIIVDNGGFDVIIGNPPYVEYSKVKAGYEIHAYKTEPCGNLYAFVVERNKYLMNKSALSGMIVPHSAFCTDRMLPLIKLFDDTALWVSTYDIRPSKLFNGVDQRLAIYITKLASRSVCYITKYNRWNEEGRDALFTELSYIKDRPYFAGIISKNPADIFFNVFDKVRGKSVGKAPESDNYSVYYHNAPRYWIRATNLVPYFWNERDGEQQSSQIKSLAFAEPLFAKAVCAALNSSLFYWWFILLSDCRHLNTREIERFPLGLSSMSSKTLAALGGLCDDLMADYQRNSKRKECVYKTTGKVVYDEYYPKLSKPIIDQIDAVLAEHYGFTEEELDYIVNYDIKYRMGIGTSGDTD
jgi:hypothetical protein